jgi:hypothetical protein
VEEESSREPESATILYPSLEGDIVKGKDRKQNTVTQRLVLEETHSSRSNVTGKRRFPFLGNILTGKLSKMTQGVYYFVKLVR